MSAAKMSDDLVKWLRAVDHMSVEDCFLQSPLFARAADHIEAMETENAKLQSSLCDAVATIGRLSREIGEAIGKLEASEMAGVVNGWRERAEKAEKLLAKMTNHDDSARTRNDKD